MLHLLVGMAGSGKTTKAIEYIKDILNSKVERENELALPGLPSPKDFILNASKTETTASKKDKLCICSFSHHNRKRISRILAKNRIKHESRVFAHLKYIPDNEYWLETHSLVLFDELTLMNDGIDYSIILDIFAKASKNPDFHVFITMDFNQVCNCTLAVRMLKLALTQHPELLDRFNSLEENHTPRRLLDQILFAEKHCLDLLNNKNIFIDDLDILLDNYRNDEILGNNGAFWKDPSKFYAKNYDKKGVDKGECLPSKVKSNLPKRWMEKTILGYIRKGYKILTSTTTDRERIFELVNNVEYHDDDCIFGNLDHNYCINIGQSIVAIENDNNYNKRLRRFLNGDRCVVKKVLNSKNIDIYYDEGDDDFDTERRFVLVENIENGFEFSMPISEFSEYFSPDYAMCITKGQGSQFDNVVLYIPAESHGFYNLIYTGISRAVKNLVILSDDYSRFENKWRYIPNIMENWNCGNIIVQKRIQALEACLRGAMPGTTKELYDLYNEKRVELGYTDSDLEFYYHTFSQYIGCYFPHLRTRTINKTGIICEVLLHELGFTNKARPLNLHNFKLGLDEVSNLKSSGLEMFESCMKSLDSAIPGNVYSVTSVNHEDLRKDTRSYLSTLSLDEKFNMYMEELLSIKDTVIVSDTNRNNQIRNNAIYLAAKGCDLFTTILILLSFSEYAAGGKFHEDKYLLQIISGYEAYINDNIKQCGNSNTVAGKKHNLKNLSETLAKSYEIGELLPEDTRTLDTQVVFGNGNKVPLHKFKDPGYRATKEDMPEGATQLGYKVTNTEYVIIDVDSKLVNEELLNKFPKLKDTYHTVNPYKDGSVHYYLKSPSKLYRTTHLLGCDFIGNGTVGIVWESNRTAVNELDKAIPFEEKFLDFLIHHFKKD